MIFLSHIPTEPLSRFISSLWYFEDAQSIHSMERVLPDGSCELLINLQETPRKLFDRNDTTCWDTFRTAWLSGPQTEFLVIDSVPRASMLGVHFNSGGLFPFLGMPADELTGQVANLDSVWGREGQKLRERLLEQPTPKDKFDLLERYLIHRLHGHLEHNPAVAYALRCFRESPREATVARVLQSIGCSHKHFIALFTRATGMTPKKFCRLQRFQLSLREIETRKCIEWADIAVDCGYYDQAHFINDFKAFSGLNPERYLSQKGEYLNFVPMDQGGDSPAAESEAKVGR